MPSFKALGSTATVRENRALNPAFEGASGTKLVRTNLAIRPRMQDTSLGGYGTQTLTPVTGIPTHPNGITTALRVAYNLGVSNSGAMVLLTPAVSTQYALSAWVYNEGTVTEPMSIALQGEASAPGVGIVPGVWTRLEWVMTTSASARAGYGVRIGTPSATGSFLITGITAELSPIVVPTFFDGATAASGDFTYSWNGTAAISASSQRASLLTIFTTRESGSSRVYQRQAGITTKSGLIYKAGGYAYVDLILTGLAASTSYIYSVDVIAPTSSVITVDRGVAGAGYTPSSRTITPNVLTRISRTFATAAGESTRTLSIAGWENVDAPDGSMMILDNLLIESGEVALTYFDGDTAAAGDFTYMWDGSANNAISLQKAPTFDGLLLSGSANRVSWLSTDRGKSSRPFARTLIKTSAAVGLNIEDGRLRAGVARRTDTIWIRVSRATTVKFRWRRPSTGFVYSNTAGIAIPADQWTELRQYRGGFDDDNVCAGILLDITSVMPGDIYDLAEHMTTEGTYTGDHVDGTSPFSKWDGTANASTSIGYPQQLLDLAGKPLVDVTTPGSYVLDDSFGITEPRTFYSVYSVLAVPVPSTPVVTYGVTGLADTVSYQTMMLRLQMSGATLGALNRRTAGAGPVSYNLPIGSAINVSCWGMLADGTQYIRNNGNGQVVSNQIMATPHQQIDVFNPSAFHRHIRTIAYRGDHDAATKLAVSRYLGNKYGAAVA